MVRPGRNDPCPCGSGKKYKKCCLARDQAAEAAERAVPLAQRVARAFASDDFITDPDELEEISNRVIDLIDAGQLDEAERLATTLLNDYPQVVDGHERLAIVAEARGDLANAVHLYQRALEFTMIHDGFEEEGRDYYRDKISDLSEKLRSASQRAPSV
jgi:tetratricopeptide (TPR) repeat protein